MLRKIIRIDADKCNGCGICIEACHEGAIGMKNDKAVLLRDDYCDGLGDCLPACPTGAISFETREALAYDEEAVLKKMAEKSGGCPGSKALDLKKEEKPLPCGCSGSESKAFERQSATEPSLHQAETELRQWPVQIKLVPVNAPYFEGAKLLIAADCSAFAYGNFHQEFMKGRVTLIGCPKLDLVDYSEKLTAILKNNNIKSVTVVRMQVPCCGGIESAAIKALKDSEKFIPWQVVTLSTNGNIVSEL